MEATLFSVALQISLDALVKNLNKSLTCKKECKKLELAIERHRPQLLRLAKEVDEREKNGQVLVAMDEWCAQMKALLVQADEIVHEFKSGRKRIAAVFSANLATRIEEIRTLIEERLMHTTLLETFLATNTHQQGHCPAATNLHHCHCPAANTLQHCHRPAANTLQHCHSPAANTLQHCHCPAANTLQCCHCLRRTTFPGASSSRPHLQTVQSDPLSHHSASDFPDTSHLRHSRSEEVFSNVDNFPVMTVDQFHRDVNRINAAEQRTRAQDQLHRRHSTTGVPHYPKSGASGYPVARYFEPETWTHAPSAPPLQMSTPSSPGGPSGSKSSYLGDGPLLRALQKGHKG